MCKAWLSIDYCASTASIFNLCVLSLDRYWSITSPLKYLRRRTKRRAFLMIAAAWALSLLWILPITGWSSMVDPYGTKGYNQTPDSCDTEFADNITFKVSLIPIFFFQFFFSFCLSWKRQDVEHHQTLGFAFVSLQSCRLVYSARL